MKSKLLIINFFVIQFLLYAQSDSTITNKFTLRTAPISLIDLYCGSSYKIGFELKPFSRISLTGDVGGYFKNFNVWKNFTGFNMDIGLRYYLKNHKKTKHNYVSLNYFYKEQGFDYHDSIRVYPTTYFTNYRTEKFVTCVNINYGFVAIYKKRLVLDFYAGIGIRHKKVNSTLTTKDLNNGIQYSDSQSLYFLVTPGKFVYPNLNLGLRIGLIIF